MAILSFSIVEGILCSSCPFPTSSVFSFIILVLLNVCCHGIVAPLLRYYVTPTANLVYSLMTYFLSTPGPYLTRGIAQSALADNETSGAKCTLKRYESIRAMYKYNTSVKVNLSTSILPSQGFERDRKRKKLRTFNERLIHFHVFLYPTPLRVSQGPRSLRFEGSARAARSGHHSAQRSLHAYSSIFYVCIDVTWPVLQCSFLCHKPDVAAIS
jgi:hypothetical protein